ncbi:lytic transglycosylase domain-containing protein [Listeria ilorinensis]|uniref:lytic transglycosylase domain-containing protein n=1 Tax=Listeria ilorinensis TaxID=2867439 RepID=UPI001EF5B84A|nr:lytic transglycosylase domain-containing protein [Listeria ilorinensis]
MNPVEQVLQAKRTAFEASFQASRTIPSNRFSSELKQAITSKTSSGKENQTNKSDLSYQMDRAKEIYTKLLHGGGASSSPSAVDAHSLEQTDTSAPITDSRFKPIAAQNEGKYQAFIEKASATYNVPAALIKRIIEVESGFNPNAISSAGATGLMQLMYGTDRTDPETNIMQGTKQLAGYIKQYDGDLKLALAAYNAGPGNVKKYGGVPPFKETIQYIDKILTK